MFGFRKKKKYFGTLNVKAKKYIFNNLMFIMSIPWNRSHYNLEVNTKDVFEVYAEGKMYKLIAVNPVYPSAREAFNNLYYKLREIIYNVELSNGKLFAEASPLLVVSAYMGKNKNQVKEERESEIINVSVGVNGLPKGFKAEKMGTDFSVVLYTIPELEDFIKEFVVSEEFLKIKESFNLSVTYPFIRYFNKIEPQNESFLKLKKELLESAKDEVDREYVERYVLNSND